MKVSVIVLLGITLLVASCKDSNTESVSEDKEKTNSEMKTEKKENSNTYSQTEEISKDTEASNSNNNSETSKTTTSEDKTKQNIQNSNLSGTYIKTGEEIDNSCTCYCVNINYTANSEMCLTPSKIFINTRMVKASNNLTNIFLVAPSSKNTEGKDIPWPKFDTNTPIANITSKGNGEIELDWLGFTMNGDLAIDYAILGKKTLEGNYKKK
ncbi:hypothetical protein [Gillisia sp. JM1]|uniref:hypothetical protein n=1 Tax=Gillisia sp. JM1 TaxID=1283286 RepID=UPI0004031EE1|nr:hypothetical protein [Gillisia sp. JM1]